MIWQRADDEKFFGEEFNVHCNKMPLKLLCFEIIGLVFKFYCCREYITRVISKSSAVYIMLRGEGKKSRKLKFVKNPKFVCVEYFWVLSILLETIWSLFKKIMTEKKPFVQQQGGILIYLLLKNHDCQLFQNVFNKNIMHIKKTQIF